MLTGVDPEIWEEGSWNRKTACIILLTTVGSRSFKGGRQRGSFNSPKVSTSSDTSPPKGTATFILLDSPSLN